MLISVASLVASLLWARGISSLPTGSSIMTGTDIGLKRRDYTPSTINDLIPLKSAETYQIFALSGISTVPGTIEAGQVVHGDIGVAPISLTAITGFGAVQEGKSNTLFVTGNIHGPPYSTDTPSDIVNAYNIAAGKTPSGPIITGAGTLDSGIVMTPGVYQWTGALALGVDKTLTLNGQCGDIFIFQTAGAITTGANSQVVLTGGLTAATVYWVSATSLSTGVSSSFSGIVLTKTNVVIAGTLVGAVYAQTEIALHAATISAPIATFASTQIGSVCNVATCAVNYGLSAGACIRCQAGYVSGGGIDTCKSSSCTGVNFINSLGACLACSVGTLSCDVNTGFALSCSPGYFGSSTTACAGCTPGFASPGGVVSTSNNACTGCSAGFFASSSLASACGPCNGGSTSTFVTCASDTGNDVTCPAGLALGPTTKSGSTTTCNTCLDGYFSLDTATKCTACRAGFVSNDGLTCIACSGARSYALASPPAASCSTSTDPYSITVDHATGISLTCASNYGLNSQKICQILSYARFLRYDIGGSNILGRRNGFNNPSQFPTATSEGACAISCAASGADRFTFGGLITGPYYQKCLCKESEDSASALTVQAFFISGIAGTCANYQKSYSNCQDVIFAADGSCSALGGGTCSCIDTSATSCNAISGASTRCVAGSEVINGVCTPCTGATFQSGGAAVCIPCLDNFAASCSNSGTSVTCTLYYTLTNNVCQPFQFAKYPGQDNSGNDLEYAGFVTSEAACLAICIVDNPLANSGFTSFAFAPVNALSSSDTTSNTGRCWCKRWLVSDAELSPAPSVRNALFVGTCDLYNSRFTDLLCENVQYSDAGCIEQNGNACICDDPEATSCSPLTGQSTACKAGYGVSNGVCFTCQSGSFSIDGSNSCQNCPLDQFANGPCNTMTGDSLVCIKYYGVTSGKCYPIAYAKIADWNIESADVGYVGEVNSEIACSLACTTNAVNHPDSDPFDGFSFGLAPGVSKGKCFCKSIEKYGLTITHQTGVWNALLFGECSKYPYYQRYGCENVQYTTSGCINQDGHTACVCDDPLAATCDINGSLTCAANSYGTPGSACTACSSGSYSPVGSTSSSQCGPLYSILVTDSDNANEGYLSNQGVTNGWIGVQDAPQALQIFRPSSFLASDMPINLLSTTLGIKSDSDINSGQPGFGYSLAFALNDPSLNFEATSSSGIVILTQSTTDDVAEYFNQANDLGNKAASKIWVIGAFDSVNGRYPLSFSIYGNPDSSVAPITNVNLISFGNIIHGTPVPDDVGPKAFFYLVPSVNYVVPPVPDN